MSFSLRLLSAHARLIIAASIVATAAAGCDKGAREEMADSATTIVKEDSAAGIIIPSSQPYTVVTLERPGSMTGSVELADSVGLPSEGVPVGDCPAKAASSAKPATPAAVVWVDGIDAGKALPVDRRYELTSEGCAIEPRIQGVVTGGAINVFNADRALHRLVFIRRGTTDTLQVMPFANSGQLVATDRLTKRAGIVEVRCVNHAWMLGYIAVFDHPYFAVATHGETFSIESLPSGTHTVMSWTERLSKPFEQRVDVPAGAAGSVMIH